MLTNTLICSLCGAGLGCDPSVEDHVADLGTGRSADGTRQAILLAKDRAVDPLLFALEADSTPAQGREAVLGVLAGLSMRVDDPRITQALLRSLRSDVSSSVRAAAARYLGLFGFTRSVGPLVAAIDDDHEDVRLQAVLSLSQLEETWTNAERTQIESRMLELMHDSSDQLRTEASVHVETRILALHGEASRAIVRGHLAEAEATLLAALEYHPESLRARYRLARFYLDEIDVEVGTQMLRQHGMLIDVPRLVTAPVVDGWIGEAEWSSAARVSAFWGMGDGHPVPLPTKVETSVSVGLTDEGLYLGWICYDDAPQDIVTKVTVRDDLSYQSWREDRVEFHLDHETRNSTPYRMVAVNSLGAVVDTNIGSFGEGPEDWDGDIEAVARVAADRWTVEFVLRFNGDTPGPAPGDLWAGNFVRSYRGSEYLQWMRTYPNGLVPDDFGILRFP